MITKFQIELGLPEHLRTNQIGSVLHGVLMELLPSDIVKELHNMYSYNPLKQRVLFSESTYVNWEIVSFNELISESLSTIFHEQSSIYIKHHDVIVPIREVSQHKENLQSMIDRYFSDEEPERYVTIQIVTPMSFKSGGRYDLFPDVRKFFRSIMLQFDTFFDSYKMYDHDTLLFISEQVHIVNYRLKSTRYHLEGIKIPSFTGQITFQLNGPNHFKQLLLFLLYFGSLTGSGIKTSLGMGKYILI